MSEIEIAFPEITGDVPEVARTESGLYSLDKMLGGPTAFGIPIRALFELYGREGVGKSSLAYYLAGSVRPKGKVGIMDTEGSLDPTYLRETFGRAGFSGEIKVIDMLKEVKKKTQARAHSEMLNELTECLLEDDYNAIILDSIGMYISAAEKEGKIGDANMGRRAKDITAFGRRAMSYLAGMGREPPKITITINHVLQSLSHRGHETPGGRGIKHAAAFRLIMYPEDKDFAHGAMHAKVKLEKLRWGGIVRDENEANVFMIPGVGIHSGITAILDCVDLGLAKRGATVKYKTTKSGEEVWNSAGRIGTLIEAAIEGNEKKFSPFYKLIKEHRDGTATD